jgi:hypothetical protein
MNLAGRIGSHNWIVINVSGETQMETFYMGNYFTWYRREGMYKCEIIFSTPWFIYLFHFGICFFYEKELWKPQV